MQTWRTSRLSNTWTLSTFDSLYSGRDPASCSKIWALICRQCLNTHFHIWLPLHLNLNRTAFTASGVRGCHVEECRSKLNAAKDGFVRSNSGVQGYTAKVVCKSPTTVFNFLAHRSRKPHSKCSIYNK